MRTPSRRRKNSLSSFASQSKKARQRTQLELSLERLEERTVLSSGAFVPGDLYVSTSTYMGTASTVTQGQPLPGSLGLHAVADGTYPGVWANDTVDGSFGVSSPVSIQQLTSSGTPVGTIDVTGALNGGVTTSFSSKSEMALNLSQDGTALTFMGYESPQNALDVSNSNTQNPVDPTNPVSAQVLRAVIQINADGSVQATPVNAYSGNNGRAAILATNGDYYLAGNAGNGGFTIPGSITTTSGSTAVTLTPPANSSTTTAILSVGELITDPNIPANDTVASIIDDTHFTISNAATASGTNSKAKIVQSGTTLSQLSDNTGVQMAVPGGSPNTTVVGQVNGTSGSSTGYQRGFSITNTNPLTGQPYSTTPDKTGKDDNFRGETVFNNTLYVTKGSGGNGIDTVYQVGTAGSLPTLANAGTLPITPLPGFPTTLASSSSAQFFPFGIWFANSTTLYVADEGDGTVADAASDPNAGLEKWSLVNGVWQLDDTLQAGLNLGVQYSVANGPNGEVYPTSLDPATDGLRNLSGVVNPDGTVTIYAVTSTVSASGDQGADPNKLVSITDNPSATTPLAGQQFTTVETAGYGQVLRGVSAIPKANPTISTTPSPTVTLGTGAQTLSDTAVLAGGSNPTGSLSFTLTGPNGFSFTTTDTVTGDGTYTATTTLPTTGAAAGTYTWSVSYSGDASNNSATDLPISNLGDVFYIDMENHNLTQPSNVTAPQQLLNNPAAPYLNSLMTPGNPNAAQSSYASNYYNALYGTSANIHPSEPNYVWQEAGLTGPLNDADPYPNNLVDGPNLSALLQAAGVSWKSYQEDIDLTANSGSVNQPAPNALTSTVAPQSEWTVPTSSISGTSAAYTNAYNGNHQYNFAAKHDGSLFFTATNGGSPTAPNFSPSNPEAQFYAPLQQLQTDLNNNTLARYNLITPDQYNDMHSSLNTNFTYNGVTYTHNTDQESIAMGDNFLSKIVPMIEASQAYKNNGAIVIWYDETEHGNTSDFTVPEIILSPLAKGNAYNSTLVYTHSSDLKSMQELFGVRAPDGGFLGDSNTPGTNDLSDFFKPEQTLVLAPGANVVADAFGTTTNAPAGNSLYLVGGNTSDQVTIQPIGSSNDGSTGIQVQGQLNGANLNNSYNQAFSTISILGSGGNDNINVANSLTIPVVVSEGDGNDNIQLGNGNNTINAGNGNDTIQAGNGNNLIVAGAGHDNVLLGSGINAVTLGNGNNDQVQLGNGNNTVTVGNGYNDLIQTGDGNNVVVEGNGYGDQFLAGSGANTVTVGDGKNDLIQVGSGNNTVTVGNGNNDQVYAGDGNNVVVEGNGNNDLIRAGNGDNLIVGGLGKHNLQAGNGNNILIDGSVSQNIAALEAVLTEWMFDIASGMSPAAIQSDLSPSLTVTFNTANANTLNASTGFDWFWYTYGKDQTNIKPTDLLNAS